MRRRSRTRVGHELSLSLPPSLSRLSQDTRDTRKGNREKRLRNAEVWKKLDCPPLPPTQPTIYGPAAVRFRRTSRVLLGVSAAGAGFLLVSAVTRSLLRPFFPSLLPLSLLLSLSFSLLFARDNDISLVPWSFVTQAACRIKRDISEDARR